MLAASVAARAAVVLIATTHLDNGRQPALRNAEGAELLRPTTKTFLPLNVHFSSDRPISLFPRLVQSLEGDKLLLAPHSLHL